MRVVSGRTGGEGSSQSGVTWFSQNWSIPEIVELQKGATVAFDRAPVLDADLTLPPNVDLLHFGILSPQETLGWVGARGLEALWAKNSMGQNL